MKARTKKNKTRRKQKWGGNPMKGGQMKGTQLKGNKSSLKRNNAKHNKTFRTLKCSPKPVSERNHGESTVKTCYNQEHLFALKDMWNQRNPNNQITTIKLDELWLELKQKLSNVCDKESCWYKQFSQSKYSEQEINELFAPNSPQTWKKDPNEWLSSTDIIKVMRQYEKIYKCFTFLGPSPVDYDFMETQTHCVWDDLCKFQLQKHIDSGKFKIGIIFNIDKHTGPGIHWVSLFINMKRKIIFYFDSAGNEIPTNIKKFVDMVIDQGKQLSNPILFDFDQNYPKQHQYSTTECGMYSLFFIVRMLEDKLTTQYLKTHVLTDKYIEKFRKIFYNDSE